MTAGEMGDLPDWYSTIQAAKYLGVTPWELADKPLAWQEWAIAAMAAEGAAEEERRRKADRKGGGGKRKHH